MLVSRSFPPSPPVYWCVLFRHNAQNLIIRLIRETNIVIRSRDNIILYGLLSRFAYVAIGTRAR